jgi:hypothetical protein
VICTRVVLIIYNSDCVSIGLFSHSILTAPSCLTFKWRISLYICQTQKQKYVIKKEVNTMKVCTLDFYYLLLSSHVNYRTNDN